MEHSKPGHTTSLGRTIAFATNRLVAPVEGMHHAIADRWFTLAGRAATPIRAAHDAVSRLVYTSIRVTGTAVGAGLDLTALRHSPASDKAEAVGLALFHSPAHRRRLRTAPMTVRHDGVAVPPSRLAAAFPDATGRLVFLVHGLAETERTWQSASDGEGLLGKLSVHPALTPLTVRYDSGLAVGASGAQLADLVEQYVEAWPVPVESVAMVGNSMGGLVIRSACEVAGSRHLGWLERVTDVVTIATPHRGAPLEKAANLATLALSVARETRPLAEFLQGRSDGIKDLRFGAINDADWGAARRDELVWDTADRSPLAGHISHHFVAGVLTSDPEHPFGAVVGDMMVRPASATGRSRLDPTNVVTVGGTRHSDLRHNSHVIDHVIGWLG